MMLLRNTSGSGGGHSLMPLKTKSRGRTDFLFVGGGWLVTWGVKRNYSQFLCFIVVAARLSSPLEDI